MASEHVSKVNAILKDRHKINDPEQIKKLCFQLFDLALTDSDAAEALLAKPNRFAQTIPLVISKEELLKFVQIHNESLVNRLIEHIQVFDEALGNEIKREILRKPKSDKKEQIDEGRTHLAIKTNPLIIEKDSSKGIMLDGEFIPMVSRNTHDFNKKLCSVGASTSREVILLDPNERLLKDLYKQLKAQLPSIDDPQVILKVVKKMTRNCFKGTKPESFIIKNLNTGKKIIFLNEFILESQGICRHHALLNAYFLSRLVQDQLLKGKVIHHRQNFNLNEGHVWNIFQAQNGKVYSLDSLWDNVTCITDKPGAIDLLYRQDVESKIVAMHFAVPPKENQANALAEKRVEPDIQCVAPPKENQANALVEKRIEPDIQCVAPPKENQANALAEKRVEPDIQRAAPPKENQANALAEKRVEPDIQRAAPPKENQVNALPEKIIELHIQHAAQPKEEQVNKIPKMTVEPELIIITKDAPPKNELLEPNPANFDPQPQPPNSAEKIKQIKQYIEHFNFTVGDYFLWKGGLMLKLDDGREKRVPHRVYDIYQKIKNSEDALSNPSDSNELWLNVQMTAQSALDHPRPGRNRKTTAFYNKIVNDQFLLDDEVNIKVLSLATLPLS